MKRINSNSWKTSFDGDNRHSQDSAFSSSQDRLHNSQFNEFSQVSTQDLFGQSSQSQNEQNSQKMSMYDKWLTKRPMSSKSNQRENTMNSWNSVNAGMRFDNKTTPSSLPHGFSVNKLRADEKDERDKLEMMLNSFHESRQEMKSLAVNFKEMVEKMGGTFSDETNSLLSMFLKEIGTSHDDLLSQIQINEKVKTTEKEWENKLATKDNHIAILETKLKLLEEQRKDTTSENEDKNRQVKEFKQDMKFSHQLVMKKLEEITDNLCNQKDAVNQCNVVVEELKGDFISTSKSVQNGVKESETRIMNEMKKLPKDFKNELDIISEIHPIIEGLPNEIEQSLKTNLRIFSKDIKDGFTKEQKKHGDQLLKKQFDRIFQKLESFVTEHKKIQEFVTENIQESLSLQLQSIDQNVTRLKDSSSSDSNQIGQIQRSVSKCQEEHTKQLKIISDRQKEFSEQIKSFLEDNERPKSNMENSTNEERTQFENSPIDKLVKRTMTNSTQDSSDVMQLTSYNEKAMTFHYPNVNQNGSPTDKVVHKVVDTKVNTIHMPVIKQTSKIFSPSDQRQEIYKSPYLSIVDTNSQQQLPTMIADKCQRDESGISIQSDFKRPNQTYSKFKHPSEMTIKPNSNVKDSVSARDIKVNREESQRFYGSIKNSLNKTNNHSQQSYPFEINSNYNDQKNGYWLRRKNDQFLNDNSYITETPIKTSNARDRYDDQYGRNVNSSKSKSNTREHQSGIVRRTPVRRYYSAIPNTRNKSKANDDVNVFTRSIAPKTSNHVSADSKHRQAPCRKRQWCERGDQDREDTGARKHDINTSVYDFNDEDDLPRQIPPYRRMDYDEDRSSVSSPALTIDLVWKETPSMVRTNQGQLKSDKFSRGMLSNRENASLLLGMC